MTDHPSDFARYLGQWLMFISAFYLTISLVIYLNIN